jgi:hypothetical protein
MNDFFGQPLVVGDEVAFMDPDYRNMITGKIISFAPKSMLIEWVKVYSERWSVVKTFRATQNQVIKKP